MGDQRSEQQSECIVVLSGKSIGGDMLFSTFDFCVAVLI